MRGIQGRRGGGGEGEGRRWGGEDEGEGGGEGKGRGRGWGGRRGGEGGGEGEGSEGGMRVKGRSREMCRDRRAARPRRGCVREGVVSAGSSCAGLGCRTHSLSQSVRNAHSH